MEKTVITLLIILIYGCFGTKSAIIETAKLEEAYLEVNFSPELIENKLDNGLEIEIQPIDAKNMDEITYKSSGFDGDYNQSASNLDYQQVLESKKLDPNQKKYYDRKSKAISYVQSKVASTEIPEVVGDILSYKLLNKEEGITGTEREIGRGYPSSFNPYKINRKYLSVFKIKIHNKSDKTQKFKIEDLIINSGFEQLYPFNIEYFKNIYSGGSEEMKGVYRLNLPNEMAIPANETVIKYFSIPSINPSTENLSVKVLNADNSTQFNYKVSSAGSSQSTTLQKFTFKLEKERANAINRYYYVLVTEDNQKHMLQHNSIYLAEDLKNEKVSLYGIASRTLYFLLVKKENFKLSDYDSNNILLDYAEKNKY